LDELGEICAAHGVWFHVDGAHGASWLLSESGRALLAGVDRADSLVWDAHKMLATSSLCAAVLVRRGSTLYSAFPLEASYIVDALDHVGVDVIQHQIECTKSPLGLKLMLVLAFVGEVGLGAHVDGLSAGAARLADRIEARPDLELLVRPQANILCFRPVGASDAALSRLRRELLEEGSFHLTQADVAGRRWLRLTLMNPLTDDGWLDRLLATVVSRTPAEESL
jgi:L-2,4-diaminobutyrate decarboxylase